jgi:hypothetical protein
MVNRAHNSTCACVLDGVLFRVSSAPHRRAYNLLKLIVWSFLYPSVRSDSVFSVAEATIRNSLPTDITSGPIVTIFRSRLETFLFPPSFSGTVCFTY